MFPLCVLCRWSGSLRCVASQGLGGAVQFGRTVRRTRWISWQRTVGVMLCVHWTTFPTLQLEKGGTVHLVPSSCTQRGKITSGALWLVVIVAIHIRITVERIIFLGSGHRIPSLRWQHRCRRRRGCAVFFSGGVAGSNLGTKPCAMWSHGRRAGAFRRAKAQHAQRRGQPEFLFA